MGASRDFTDEKYACQINPLLGRLKSQVPGTASDLQAPEGETKPYCTFLQFSGQNTEQTTLALISSTNL